MSRFYVRINHDTDPTKFHSFIVTRDGLKDVAEYSVMLRDRILNEHNGEINIIRVGPGHSGTNVDVQEQYDNVTLLYVDKVVAPAGGMAA